MASNPDPKSALDELSKAVAKSQQLTKDLAEVQARVVELARLVAENAKAKESGIKKPN